MTIMTLNVKHNMYKSFSTQGQSPSTEIGRVYVFDKDDWDIADKTFNWKDGKAHPYFSLNSESGGYLHIVMRARLVTAPPCRDDHDEARGAGGPLHAAV